MNENNAALPRSFWMLSSAALAWNLIGLFIYVTQVTMTEETLAATVAEVSSLRLVETWRTAGIRKDRDDYWLNALLSRVPTSPRT